MTPPGRPEYVGHARYLSVWIARLRRKLDRERSKRSMIRTYPGVGYLRKD